MKVTIKGGRFNADAFLKSLAPTVKRGGLAMMGAVMEATPVKTGHLRRGWNVGEPSVDGRVIRVKIGNAVVYARRRQYEGRTKGYVDRGVAKGRAQAERVIRDGAAQAAQKLWEAR